MGDYDVNPINMALGVLAAVVVAVVILTNVRLGWVAENRKTADIKAARYHACLGIADESLRTICVIGGER